MPKGFETIVLMIGIFIIIILQEPLLTSALTTGGLMLKVKFLRRKHFVDVKSMFNMERVTAIHFIPISLCMIGVNILVSEIGNFTTRIIPISGFGSGRNPMA